MSRPRDHSPYRNFRSLHHAMRMMVATLIVPMAAWFSYAYGEPRILLVIPLCQLWYAHAARRVRRTGDDALGSFSVDLAIAGFGSVTGVGIRVSGVAILLVAAWATRFVDGRDRIRLWSWAVAMLGMVVAVNTAFPSSFTPAQQTVMLILCVALYGSPALWFIGPVRRRLAPTVAAITDYVETGSSHSRLIARLPAAIYRAAVDGTVIEANPAMERVLATTDHAGPLPEPEERAEFVRSLYEAGSMEGVLRMRRDRSGRPRWMMESAYAHFDTHGRMTYFEGVLEDITEIKLAEEAAEAAAVSLQEQIAHHQTLVQLAIRLHRSHTDLVPADALAPLEIDVGTSITIAAGETPTGDVEDGILPIVVGDAPAGAIVVTDPSRMSASGWMTLRAAAEMIGGFWERVAARSRLEQLVESKDEFLASISHELRTPLTSIVGFAEVLLTSPHLDGEDAEMIRIVNGQAIEMAALIEDLLVASRAELDRLAVVDSVFSLDQELTNIVGSLQRYAGARPVTLDLDAGISVSADPIRVRQVMRNLLTNAFRYGGDQVTVRTRRAGHQVRIMVCDDGPPIPREAIERIFEPYERVEPAAVGGPSSVGLGLSVSRTLAQLMGGELVYHHTGSESVFVFTLQSPAMVTVS